MLFRIAHFTVIALALSACGGSSDDDKYNAAIAAANAKEAEAIALASESPCTQTQECGVLAFLTPDAVCSNYTYKPYSLISSSAAAASAAATQQVALAGDALSLAPPSNIACLAIVQNPPALVCTASQCQAAP